MRVKSLISDILPIIMTVLVLSGCTQINITESQPAESTDQIFSPSLDLTLTPKPTSFFPSSPTPHSTLQPDKALQMFVALQDENCKLPCYLGITPGETLLQDANAILVNFGASALGEYIRQTDNILSYTYTLDIGDQSLGEKLISHSVSLLTTKNIVQAVIVSVGTLSSESSLIAKDTFRAYWQRYTIENIFLQLGEPEGIFTNRIVQTNMLGADLIVLYDKKNLSFDLYGTGQENSLCPKNEAKSLYVNMFLSYSDSPVNIYAASNGNITNQEIYPPLEEVFGITTNEFYMKVIETPFICFEPKE